MLSKKKSLAFLKKIGDNYNVTVLEGITGSGKTLVYFERVRDIVVQRISGVNITS